MPGFYRRYGKRALDIVLAVLALAVLSPLMLFIAILVRLSLGSPVVFGQQRPGLHGRFIHNTQVSYDDCRPGCCGQAP